MEQQTRNSEVSEVEVFLDQLLNTMSLMSDQQNALASKVDFLESENASLRNLVLGQQSSFQSAD